MRVDQALRHPSFRWLVIAFWLSTVSTIAVGLLLNGIWIIRRVHYCARCGRTFQRGIGGDKTRCPTCAMQPLGR